MRPIYETPEQREAERVMAERVAAAWKCGLLRRPDLDSADWVLTARGGRVTRAFMECKDRSRYTMAALDGFGGVFCSQQKWVAARDLHRDTGVPFVFVVQTEGRALWYHHTTDFTNDGLVVGGRRDRNDPLDIEPCILLQQQRFARVTAAPVEIPIFHANEINW